MSTLQIQNEATQKTGKKMIVFAGGGTGGHVFPIISVYEELKKNNDNLQFCYFGSKDKIEEKISIENKIDFYELPFLGGMPRSFKAVFWAFKFLNSLFQAVLKLLKLKPQIVFSTGGYSAAPVICAAYLLKIPYIIHNLDAHMGLSNKAFVKHASALTLGIPLSENKEDLLPKNGPVIVTGNPIRRAFYSENVDKNEIYKKMNLDANRKTLIVIGGSQGAEAININLLRITSELTQSNWQIIHQLGPLQYEKFKELFPNDPNYRAEKFINNLDEIYSIADLAVSRSGAMSVSELSAKKLPAILIPLPTSAQNHQYLNAKYMEEQGGSVILEQKDLDDHRLLKMIEYVHERQNLFRLNLKNLPVNKPSEIISQIILKCLSV